MGEPAVTSLYPLISTFNRGEISPLLASRVDVDSWRQSLAHCRNFHVLTHGGLRRRSGSRFIAELKDSSAPARILPFIFSESQSYVTVMNGGAIRFVALRGVIGAPYEISYPWADADLSRLSTVQFNDIAYFAHKGYQPRKLSRKGDTNWTLDPVAFANGPYLDGNPKGSLKPSGTGGATQKMTSNSGPGATVSATNGTASAYQLFDWQKSVKVTIAAGSAGDVNIDFGSGVTKVIDAYWIVSGSDNERNSDMPKQWTLFGSNDGSTWETLDSRDGESGWDGSETRFYEFENEDAYRYFRFSFTGGGGPDGSKTSLAEIAMHQSGDSQTPFDLTATSIASINGGVGFDASDVGRAIMLRPSDGRARWAKIVSVTSPTVVQVRLYGHALPDLSAIADWKLGALSAKSGWPGSVTLYNERLMWARTNTEPVTVYGSKQGIFDDYGVSDPLKETDGIKITLLSSNMSELLWLSDDEDLISGSGEQIRSVGPSDVTRSFSATNIAQKKGPTSGAAQIRPLSVGGITLYVGAGATKIRELVLGDQNRYVAPELTILAEHMFKSGVVDWAFAERPDPTIWAATGDGLLVGIVYDRDQKVLGFARHDLGGKVENVAVIPSTMTGHDDVYVVVQRTINGQTKRFLEVLERPFDGDIDRIEDAFFVDCGLSYSGSPISTVMGLGHLEGETVSVLADGGVVDPCEVQGGQITIPYAASKIHVGLPFKSRAVTLPYAGPGQDGLLFGRRRNVIAAFIDVLATGALKVGSAGSDNWTPELIEQIMKTGDGLFGSPIDLQTGFVRCDYESSWAEGNGQLVMETDQPLPALIRSIELQVESEP